MVHTLPSWDSPHPRLPPLPITDGFGSCHARMPGPERCGLCCHLEHVLPGGPPGPHRAGPPPGKLIVMRHRSGIRNDDLPVLVGSRMRTFTFSLGAWFPCRVRPDAPAGLGAMPGCWCLRGVVCLCRVAVQDGHGGGRGAGCVVHVLGHGARALRHLRCHRTSR
jgi:hypothetical protein